RTAITHSHWKPRSRAGSTARAVLVNRRPCPGLRLLLRVPDLRAIHRTRPVAEQLALPPWIRGRASGEQHMARLWDGRADAERAREERAICLLHAVESPNASRTIGTADAGAAVGAAQRTSRAAEVPAERRARGYGSNAGWSMNYGSVIGPLRRSPGVAARAA